MRCIDPGARRLLLQLRLRGTVALAAGALAGCALGPDYTAPPEVAVASVARGELLRAGAAQASPAAQPLPSAWWQALGDDTLSGLIEQALRDNPNLRAAQARLRASRALAGQRRAEQLPQLGVSAGYVDVNPPRALERTLSEATAQDVDLGTGLYTVGFDASWEIDVFGRRSRAAEGAAARADADEAALADAQVQLGAELAQAYFGLLANRQALAVTERSQAMLGEMLDLTRQRRARGAATELDIERLQAQKLQQQAELPRLRAQIAIAQDQIAFLAGREPGSLDASLAAVQTLPNLPAQVEVDDAGTLIRRRPDVRQAERQLAASSAQIGEALSGYFPQIKLTGILGLGADSLSGLTADSAAWMVSPMLSWSLLDFGRVRSRVEQARAGNEAQLALYENAVLNALQDANGALSRFGAARQQLATAQQASASADRAATLMRQRHDAGVASTLDWLDVQRQQLAAANQAVQAQAQLLVDYAALQKSLGLGWR
ncbi:MAG: efflux transporter outer membrane subunit [Comamonas sp.]